MLTLKVPAAAAVTATEAGVAAQVARGRSARAGDGGGNRLIAGHAEIVGGGCAGSDGLRGRCVGVLDRQAQSRGRARAGERNCVRACDVARNVQRGGACACCCRLESYRNGAGSGGGRNSSHRANAIVGFGVVAGVCAHEGDSGHNRCRVTCIGEGNGFCWSRGANRGAGKRQRRWIQSRRRSAAGARQIGCRRTESVAGDRDRRSAGAEDARGEYDVDGAGAVWGDWRGRNASVGAGREVTRVGCR